MKEEKYDALFEREVQNSSLPIEDFKKIFPKKHQEEYQKHINKRRARLYSEWRYNEIIGWIGIFFLCSQLRGELNYTKAKRIVKGGKKEIEHRGKLFEVSLHDIKTSRSIYTLLDNEIKLLKENNLFRNRFIDTSLFYKIGKYIDWVNLLKNSTK